MTAPAAAPLAASPTLQLIDAVRSQRPFDDPPTVIYGINTDTGVIAETVPPSGDHRQALATMSQNPTAKTVLAASDIIAVAFNRGPSRIYAAIDRDGNVEAAVNTDGATVPVGSYAGLDTDVDLVRRQFNAVPLGYGLHTSSS